jgi:hypothetical protein
VPTMARFIRDYEPDMKTAMVTGAAGVLGRATVRMLLEDGFRVCFSFLVEIIGTLGVHLGGGNGGSRLARNGSTVI